MSRPDLSKPDGMFSPNQQLPRNRSNNWWISLKPSRFFVQNWINFSILDGSIPGFLRPRLQVSTQETPVESAGGCSDQCPKVPMRTRTIPCHLWPPANPGAISQNGRLGNLWRKIRMVPFLGTWLPLVAWLRLGSARIDAESQSKIRTEFFQQFFFLRQVWSWPKAPDWCSLACKTRNAKPPFLTGGVFRGWSWVQKLGSTKMEGWNATAVFKIAKHVWGPWLWKIDPHLVSTSLADSVQL